MRHTKPIAPMNTQYARIHSENKRAGNSISQKRHIGATSLTRQR
jgi:hypothetical protein